MRKDAKVFLFFALFFIILFVAGFIEMYLLKIDGVGY